MGASPHPMGVWGDYEMDPLSLEKNQNVTSTWDVLRRLKWPRIRDMRR